MRQTVKRMLVLAAGVNDGVKLIQARHNFGGWNQFKAHRGNNFWSSGHTLCSMRAWADALGWMRSA